MLRLAVLTLLIGATVAGCSRFGLTRPGGGARVEFAGERFRARVTADRETPRDFTVAVRPASKGVEAAQEAGRFEAVKYCIRNFGNSDMVWVIGPDIPPEQAQVADDALTLAGRCTAR